MSRRWTTRHKIALTLIPWLSLLASEGHADSPHVAAFPGQSRTVLADGRTLFLGGWTDQGPSARGAVWNPAAAALTILEHEMLLPRAWHTATLLPDATVLILGGRGTDGRVVEMAERFHPESGDFETLPGAGPTPRTEHTATVVTDGRVAVIGGMLADGTLAARAEIVDPRSLIVVDTPGALATPRALHAARLLPDGAVLVTGGIDATGLVVATAERYEPQTGQFAAADPATSSAGADGPIRIEATLPANGATDVPVDILIAARFTQPLPSAALDPATVTLIGPDGLVPRRVTPAEGGTLLFVLPRSPLSPGTTYTLKPGGPAGSGGLSAWPSVRFTTRSPAAAADASGSPSVPPIELGGESPAAEATATDEDPWVWTGEKRGGRPYSRWQALPPLQAPPGVTALAGQTLRLDGEPLANVTVTLEAQSGSGAVTARTDGTGRFLAVGVASGHHEALIDGRSAGSAGRTYGVFEVAVTLPAGTTTALPYTVWMPQIDRAHGVKIPPYLPSELVITTPRLRGLELHIPPDSSIRDHEGRIAGEITITPIPLDRPPFPLPPHVDPPVYFTVQPGAGYVHHPEGRGARLVYPNYEGARRPPPDSRLEFWHYDPGAPEGWFVYGHGTVTPDGSQVIPDPGVEIYEFTGAMINVPGYSPPSTGPAPGGGPSDGDPVDLATGLFVLRKTDLIVSDVLPVMLTRTYRQNDPVSRAFGVGATHPYDLHLWSAQQYQQADLILPDGGRIHYVRTSPGTGFADAVLEHVETATSGATPTSFYRSVMGWNGRGWDVRLRDGTVYVFGDEAPLNAIRDRFGNTITVARASINALGSPTGNITRLTSPSGRFIELTYDAANRIIRAQDHTRRAVAYAYDSDGRLTTVTDPAGGLTGYTYQKSSTSALARTRMLTISDARGIKFLTNTYDSQGRVSQQTLADGGRYTFAYGPGQTDVTDPRGKVRRVTFNAGGYMLTDTRASGTPEQQTLTYERQAGNHLVLAVTDALDRRTATTYDAKGNVAQVTRLAGTPTAVTTGFTHEPTWNQLASITDPLGHTTTFAHDASGRLTAVTDPLGNVTTLTSNAAGQPLSITTALGDTTRFEYDGGDLVAVIDPLGNRTTRFADAAGRMVSVTDALGRRTRYEYDALNRLTRVVDPLGGGTTFAYDANGNLLSATDARGSVTTYTYDSMDRVATRRDPLLRTESHEYDVMGNLVRFTDRKGQVTTYGYDALNRRTFAGFGTTVQRRTTTYESTLAFTYDAGNRLIRLVDSAAGPVSRVYDGLDRLIQDTTPLGSIGYAYDATGRRTSLSAPGAAVVTYGYDAADRLTRIVQGDAVIDVAHDAANRRTRLTLPNGIVTTYTYDAASRLTGLAYRHGGATLGTLSYAYDPAGNRTDLDGSWARTALPQPVASATYNAANQQLTFGGQTLTYDANGNLTGDGSATYTWDARNQLVSVTSPSLTASFQYDPLGRRTRRTVNGTVVDFLYDGLNPVVEQANGAVQATMLTGLGVDEYLTRTDASGTRAFLTDALGSTAAETDGSAIIQATHTYEPFGTVTTVGASTSPYLFTGREDDNTGLYYLRARYYDPDRARFLSEDPLHSPLLPGAKCSPYDAPSPYRHVDVAPGEGLLLAFRPYSAAIAATVNPQRMHPYTYANNSPVKLTDPMGLTGGPQQRGCDLMPDLSPCMTRCCDDHDACYRATPGWCSMWSWTIHGAGNQCLTPNAWGIHASCCACNIEAVKCALRGNALGPRKGCPAALSIPILPGP